MHDLITVEALIQYISLISEIMITKERKVII